MGGFWLGNVLRLQVIVHSSLFSLREISPTHVAFPETNQVVQQLAGR